MGEVGHGIFPCLFHHPCHSLVCTHMCLFNSNIQETKVPCPPVSSDKPVFLSVMEFKLEDRQPRVNKTTVNAMHNDDVLDLYLVDIASMLL